MNDSPTAGCLLNYQRELSLGVDVHRTDFDFIVVLCVIIPKLSSLLKRIEALISECFCIFKGKRRLPDGH
jgi:hypothetical protein